MDDNNGINGRAEAWPPMGRRPSSIMHRPNVPPRISLPQASPSPSPSPSNSSSKSASSTTSNAGYTLDPSYYASSPPPRGGQPTSAPLIRQRTAPADPSAPLVTPGLTNGEVNAAFRLPFIMRNNGPPSLLSPSFASTLSSDAEGRSSHHQHRGHERSDSTDTVRGPVLLTIPNNDDDSRASSASSNYPLTPFPEYISRSGDDRSSMAGSPANTVLRTSSTAHGGEGQKHQIAVEETARRRGTGDGVRLVLLLREEDGDTAGAFPRFRRRLTSLSSSMHGFVLGLECMVLLVVGSALVWITVSKKTAADGDFWTWLWTFGEPLVGALLLLCFGILVTHEVRPLSSVAHLYLQAAVLLLTTLAAVTLVAQCLGQESRAVKGVITGCCMWMWATAFLGFLRAVIVWKVESGTGCDSNDGEAAGRYSFAQERDAVAYGTFVLVEEQS